MSLSPIRCTALILGAVDYITKPFDREEFLACIRAVLRGADLSRQQGRVEAEAQYGRAAPGDLKDSDPRSYGPQ